jgi:lysophospholipase L1-like esterase
MTAKDSGCQRRIQNDTKKLGMTAECSRSRNIMNQLRYWLKRLLFLLVILFALDAVLVAFFRGFRVEIADHVIRSATIEFPVVGFLIALVLLLLVQGKWKETCLLVASLGLSACLGEAMLSVIDHPWSKPVLKTWLEPVPLLGFRLPSNFEGRGIVDEYIKTNSQGLRDVEHPWKKEDGTVRILGLGDSFTFGWGVKLEESFLKQLERRLTQETGRKAETINAGVPGYGLNHYYIYLKNIGIKYQPDVIVINYFVDDLPASLKEELAPYEEDFPDRLQYKGGFLHRSRFYNFITSAAAVVRVRNHATAVDHMRNMEIRRAAWARYDHPLINKADEETNDRIILLEEYLTRFKALADGAHARLVIMFIPDISHLYHREYQNVNRVLKQLTSKYDIPFVDMTPIFESSNDLSTYYLFPKDAHTNVKGHEEMASALTELICKDALSNISCGIEGLGSAVRDTARSEMAVHN